MHTASTCICAVFICVLHQFIYSIYIYYYYSALWWAMWKYTPYRNIYHNIPDIHKLNCGYNSGRGAKAVETCAATHLPHNFLQGVYIWPTLGRFSYTAVMNVIKYKSFIFRILFLQRASGNLYLKLSAWRYTRFGITLYITNRAQHIFRSIKVWKWTTTLQLYANTPYKW